MNLALALLIAAVVVAAYLAAAYYLTHASVKVLGVDVPLLLVLICASCCGVAIWMLIDLVGVKVSAALSAFIIEGLAFLSLSKEASSKGSASLWLVKAFVLGGIFISCIALLA